MIDDDKHWKEAHMKKAIKKVWKIEMDYKLLAIAALLVLFVLMMPIFRIMMYCVPWYDDFGYGGWVKRFWELKHSLWDALKGAVASARSSYYAWQGTFSSCFMMSLMPAVWGTDKYVYGLWFILLVLVFSVFYLIKVLLRDVLGADKWETLTVQAIVTATCIVLFRSPIDGLFWYNSGVHYTAMHSFGILLIALLIKMTYTNNKLQRGLLVVISVLLAFFVGGSNYVTVLQITLLVLSILIWGCIFKNKKVLWALPAAFSIICAMYINITAPGNAKRMESFVHARTSPLQAILNSFKSAVTYFDDFTGLMTLAVLLLLLPVIVKIVSKTNFTFRYPMLVLLWSFCLYATGFTPTLFTMGHTLLSRATNMAKLTFQLLLFLNEFYWIGWGCRILREKKEKEVKCRNPLCFYAAMFLVMVGIFAAEPNKGGIYSTYCAYYFVHTGEAYNYYNEYLERVRICESDEEDVIVKPYIFKPWLICLGDLSEDPEYEPNRFMADFFEKNSITCIAEKKE